MAGGTSTSAALRKYWSASDKANQLRIARDANIAYQERLAAVERERFFALSGIKDEGQSLPTVEGLASFITAALDADA